MVSTLKKPNRLYPLAMLGLAALAGSPVKTFAEDGKLSTPAMPPKSRTFLFTVSVNVTNLPGGKLAKVWLPVPPSNEDQEAVITAKDLPAPGEIDRESKFGNQILFIESKANADGSLPLSVTYRIVRKEVRGNLKKESEPSDNLSKFLQPDARVPVGGKTLELLKGKDVPRNQVAAARMLYNVVNDHMRYSKEGTGWGQGDAVWACQSGYGNCSDFHSLFISLARANHIPAKFEIGFPLPEKHGAGEIPGYHCWAKFHPDNGDWIPVDISEANKNPKLRTYYFGNLTENRVTFSTGRDLDLVPKQDGIPLNFFVYPYVEVDGKPYPAGKIQKKFTFKDVDKTGQE